MLGFPPFPDNIETQKVFNISNICFMVLWVTEETISLFVDRIIEPPLRTAANPLEWNSTI